MRRFQHQIFIAFLCLSGFWASSATSQENIRNWSIDEAGLIRAKFVEVRENGDVAIKGEDDQLRTVPFQKLVTADQDYVAWRTGSRVPGISVASRDDQPARRNTRRKWALLIGVNQYTNFGSLQYCDNDVRTLKQRLIALGFDAENVIVLSEDQAASRKPSRKNIQHWIQKLINGRVTTTNKGISVEPRMVNKDDVIVVALSGHGVLIDGVSYFCPPEADVKNYKTTMVSVEKLYADLGNVSNGLRLLLVDACRNVPRSMKAKPFEIRQQLSNGLIAISSCSVGEISIESDHLRSGVFLYYLQAALGGAFAERFPSNGQLDIKLNQVLTFAIDNTIQFVRKRSGKVQTPFTRAAIEGNVSLGTLSQVDWVSNVVAPIPLSPYYDMNWVN